MTNEKLYKRAVKIWLLIGVIMVFIQIILGGITRLTGSGLSITKWDIATGTIPPLTAEDWLYEFELYRATPQYEKINEGMTVSEFKFIYFWEFMHRLWARTMGFVFLFPFLVFMFNKWIDKILLRQLLGVVFLAAVVASFGWIMVASGLINRPWVNAYKLTTHLNLGLVLYGVLFLVYIRVNNPARRTLYNSKLRGLLVVIFWVLAVQLLLGGLMSGMKAGIYYPTWPDMNGQIVPSLLLDSSKWSMQRFVEYDSFILAPTLVQLLHRMVAYILAGLIIWFGVCVRRLKTPLWYRNNSFILFLAFATQLALGILTVINCRGVIPLFLGVMHQAGAILLLSSLLYMMFITKKE